MLIFSIASSFSKGLPVQAEIKKYAQVADNVVLDEDGEFCLFSVPLWGENKIIGVFGLFRRNEGIESDEDLVILQTIVNQIGISLEKELAIEKINTLKLSFHSIFDSITEGIIIGEEKVVYSNQMAVKLLKISESLDEQDISQLFEQIVKISKNPLITQIHLETCHTLNNSTYSFQLETKNEQFLKITRFHIKNANGDNFNQGLLVSDITKHREIEKFKNDLIAVISHELRTPLTSIIGNVSSLLRSDVQWEIDAQHAFLEDIHDECNRLNDLIEKLLDISVINAGVLKLSPNHS